MGHLWPFTDMRRMVKTLSGLTRALPGKALSSCLGKPTTNKHSFRRQLSATFPPFYASFWWFCFLKHPPKDSVEVMSNFPKCKKSVGCFLAKQCMLDQLHCYAVDLSSMVINQRSVLNKVSLNRHTPRTSLYIWSADANVMTQGSSVSRRRAMRDTYALIQGLLHP